MEIRRASVEDASEILEIQKQAYQAQGELYNNMQIHPLTQTLESLREEFHSKTFLVAILDNRVIGSVRFWRSDEDVHVERISIGPRFQNQGIGTALLTEVEHQCVDAKAFLLFTGSKSSRNIHVYQKLGYQVFEEKEDGQGILTLYMRKEIIRCEQRSP